MKILFYFTATLILFSCGNDTNEKRKHEHEEHSSQHQKHGGNHGEHNKANHYMNESEFQQLVERFENPDRDSWQKPRLVISKLGDLTGKKIADIGAGTGYFGFKLADAGAHVISIDVDERFIDFVEQRKTKSDVENLETRLAEYDDPKLKSEEVDIVFTVDTYHHFDDKIAYLKKCMSGLKPGGRIVIVDFKKKETPHGPPADHRVSGEQIAADLREAGFTKLQIDMQSLPEQNIIIATKAL